MFQQKNSFKKCLNLLTPLEPVSLLITKYAVACGVYTLHKTTQAHVLETYWNHLSGLSLDTSIIDDPISLALQQQQNREGARQMLEGWVAPS